MSPTRTLPALYSCGRCPKRRTQRGYDPLSKRSDTRPPLTTRSYADRFS
jgi:hypothetical protein